MVRRDRLGGLTGAGFPPPMAPMANPIDPSRRSALAMLSLPALHALAGCAPRDLLGADPPALYTLSPKSTFTPGLPIVAWQLLVNVPDAAAGLDTVRIAAQPEPLKLEYYVGVAWTDRAPAMVQTLLVESFENAESIIAIGRESVGLRADYVLMTELRELQVEIENETDRLARVSLGIKLVRMPDRAIVGSRTFRADSTPVESGFRATIMAMDAALGTVLKDVVEWALLTGQADWQARR